MASISNPVEIPVIASIQGSCFSPTGDRLLATFYTYMRLYDIASGSPYAYEQFTNAAHRQRKAAWCPNQELVVIANSSGAKKFLIFDVAGLVMTESTNYPATMPTQEMWSCRFSNDGSWLVVAGNNGQTFMYSVSAGGILTYHSTITTPSTGQVRNLSFSHDDLYLALVQTGGPHPTVYKNIAGTWTRIADGTTPTASLASVEFAPDSYLIIVSYNNDANICRIYDIVADEVVELATGSTLTDVTTYNSALQWLGPDAFVIGGDGAAIMQRANWNGTALSTSPDEGFVSVARVLSASYSPDTSKLALFSNKAPYAYTYDVVGSLFTETTINFPSFYLEAEADNNLPTEASLDGSLSFPVFDSKSEITLVEFEKTLAPPRYSSPAEIEIIPLDQTYGSSLPNYLYTNTEINVPSFGMTAYSHLGDFAEIRLGFPTFILDSTSKVNLEASLDLGFPVFEISSQISRPETTNTSMQFPLFGISSEIEHRYFSTNTTLGFPLFEIASNTEQDKETDVELHYPTFTLGSEVETFLAVRTELGFPRFNIDGELKLMLERVGGVFTYPAFSSISLVYQDIEADVTFGFPRYEMHAEAGRVPTIDVFLRYPAFDVASQAGTPLAVYCELRFPRFGKNSGLSARKRRNTFAIGIF